MSYVITGQRISFVKAGLLCLHEASRAINNQHDRDITLDKRGET
jgi:hypothetical protein